MPRSTRPSAPRTEAPWDSGFWGAADAALTGGAYRRRPTTPHTSRYSSKRGTGEEARIAPKIVQAILALLLGGMLRDIAYAADDPRRLAVVLGSLSDAGKTYRFTLDATDDTRWRLGGFNQDEHGGVIPSYHAAAVVIVARWVWATVGLIDDPGGAEVVELWSALVSALATVAAPVSAGWGWSRAALHMLCLDADADAGRAALERLADAVFVTTRFNCGATPHTERQILVQVADVCDPLHLVSAPLDPADLYRGAGAATRPSVSGPPDTDPDADLDLPDGPPVSSAVPDSPTSREDTGGLVETRDSARMRRALRARGAVMLLGPHGCGKTATVKAIATDRRYYDGFVYLRGSERMQAEDIYGTTMMAESGRWEFTFSPSTLTAGAERVLAGQRILFFFEELLRGHGSIPNELMAFAELHSARDIAGSGLPVPAEPGPYHVLPVPGYKTFVLPDSRTKLVATGNRGERYHGLRLDDVAFLDRFPYWIEVAAFTEAELRAVLAMNLARPAADPLITALVDVWREVTHFNETEKDILPDTVSTRSLIVWGREMLARSGPRRAVFEQIAQDTWIDKALPEEGSGMLDRATVRSRLLAFVTSAATRHLARS